MLLVSGPGEQQVGTEAILAEFGEPRTVVFDLPGQRVSAGARGKGTGRGFLATGPGPSVREHRTTARRLMLHIAIDPGKSSVAQRLDAPSAFGTPVVVGVRHDERVNVCRHDMAVDEVTSIGKERPCCETRDEVENDRLGRARVSCD